MKPIFEYGLSQEDAQIDARGLQLTDGDLLLCISSAGEIPLNFLAGHNIEITSTDILPAQNSLTRLKLQCILHLEPFEAASLLGLVKALPDIRRKYYMKTSEYLSQDDRKFWSENQELIKKGLVWGGRFEQYIARFNSLGRFLLGKKQLLRLMECISIEEQEDFFDRHLSTHLLKGLFKVAFHPTIYKKRGISEQGLTHAKDSNMAVLFYQKFKNFCCSTPARKNYFFQFTFFDEILYPEAYPEYLSEQGMLNIRDRKGQIEIRDASIQHLLKESSYGQFNKYHLSNIGDWMDKPEFSTVLHAVSKKAEAGSRLLFRYIHYNHPIPTELTKRMNPLYELGSKIARTDRYPFYEIVPVSIS